MISSVTNTVLNEVGRWQNRPSDPSSGGRKDVLGIWIEQTEGVKFRLRVMMEVKNLATGMGSWIPAIVMAVLAKDFAVAIDAQSR